VSDVRAPESAGHRVQHPWSSSEGSSWCSKNRSFCLEHSLKWSCSPTDMEMCPCLGYRAEQSRGRSGALPPTPREVGPLSCALPPLTPAAPATAAHADPPVREELAAAPPRAASSVPLTGLLGALSVAASLGLVAFRKGCGL
jgi:hypothetical protein